MKVIVGKHKIKIQKEIVNEKEINITKCKFEFDEDITQDFVKDIYFTLGDTTIKIANIQNNECNIPYEVLTDNGMVELGVVAYLVENETEIKRYNPSPAYFDTYTGSIKEEYDNYEPITPTDKEQMEQAIQNMEIKINNLDIDAEKVGTTATITITKKDGNTQQVEINDGEAGNGITSIEKTSTTGSVDTYTITYTNGTTSTFEVTNGEVTQSQLDNAVNELELENDYLNSVIEQAFDKIDGTGTSITLNDTIQARIKTDLKGNMQQTTYTGQQLFNIHDNPTVPTYSEAITFQDDYIISDYNNTSSSSREIQVYTGNLNLQGNTNYLCVCEIIEVSGNGKFRPITTWRNQNQGQFNYDYVGYDFSSLSAGQKILFTAKTYADLSQKTRGMRTVFLYSAGQSGKIKVRISILADTTITENTFTYEPYVGGTPSPNPDYPQNVNVVTGNNTITISNEDNTSSTNYSINLGTLELCKIGDYQDYIYKNNGNWYKKAKVVKMMLDGSETNYAYSDSGTGGIALVSFPINDMKSGDYLEGLCDYFHNDKSGKALNSIRFGANDKRIYFYISNTIFNSLNDFKTWLSTHNTIVYYVLDTPTYTQITDTTLINQLNNLEKAMSYKNQTNISQVNANLPFILNVTALGKISS